MQGIWIDKGETRVRPKSKKLVREEIEADPFMVELEATSLFGDEYSGPVGSAPAGTYNFVGPDPYTKRTFYGQIIIRPGTDPRIKVK